MTNRASIRARNVTQISPCVSPWFHSHLVEVLLDSCFRVLVRIEDGEVSPALPLKVPQREKHLWKSSGAMNDTSKLCRLQGDGAGVPYRRGHVLVHQVFRKRDLPS